MSHSSASSTVCRAQKAYHPDRSTETMLANVRTISVNASAAWAREAIPAEEREAKVHKSYFKDPLIELLSENPDREHADKRTALTKSDNAPTNLRELLKGKL